MRQHKIDTFVGYQKYISEGDLQLVRELGTHSEGIKRIRGVMTKCAAFVSSGRLLGEETKQYTLTVSRPNNNRYYDKGEMPGTIRYSYLT